MRRSGAIAAVALFALGLAVPVRADVPDAFKACAKGAEKDPCEQSIAVAFGTTVVLEGTVDPPHANLEAVVLRWDPTGEREQLGRVAISNQGEMRFEWKTTAADGSQTDPNHLQFRIRDHVRSNRVEVMVYLGE